MDNKCPMCNHELIAFKNGSSIGVRCSSCDYSVVTSYIEPIFEDKNVYTIILEKGNALSKDSLKTVSGIIGKNYIAAKKCISSAPSILFQGYAADVMDVKKILDTSAMKYSISPKFPY